MRSLIRLARSSSLRRLVVALMTISGIWLFARSIHAVGATQIREGLSRVGWGFTIVLLLSAAREVARTLAWTQAVEGPSRLRFVEAFRARLVGEAIGTLLPMGVLAGEPAKAVQVGRQVPFGAAFAGLAVEFFFYCSSLVPLIVAGGIFTLTAAAKMPAGMPLVMFGGILGTVAVALAAARFRRTRAGDLVLGFRARNPERVRAIAAYEAAYQVLAIAETYLTLWLVSAIPPTLASAVVLETVGRVITIVFQALPLRVGVDEAGAALFAGRLDLGAGSGITLALVRKVRMLIWSGIGLLLLSQLVRRVRPPVPASRSHGSSGEPYVIARA